MESSISKLFNPADLFIRQLDLRGTRELCDRFASEYRFLGNKLIERGDELQSMTDVLLTLVAVTMFIPTCPPQNSDVDAATQIITVRFLNGKTGKPIKGDTPNIWLSDTKRPNDPTDPNGGVVFSLERTRFKELRVLPNLYKDCRFKPDTTAGMNVKYSLEDIITTGVVSTNTRGKKRIEPIPRVLVVYVRPRTFIENWLL
jgi:hypothetical protein